MTFKQVNTEENVWMFQCTCKFSLCTSCKHRDECIISDYRELSTAEMFEERGVITENCNYFEKDDDAL